MVHDVNYNYMFTAELYGLYGQMDRDLINKLWTKWMCF